jgi:hypothetical protein
MEMGFGNGMWQPVWAGSLMTVVKELLNYASMLNEVGIQEDT